MVATNVIQYEISQDSRHLAFATETAATGGAGALSLAVIGSASSPTQLSPNAYWYQFGFSSDGSRLAYIGNLNADVEGTLMVVDVSEGAQVAVNDWVRQFVLTGSSVASLRAKTSSPFGFQDGVYVAPLP